MSRNKKSRKPGTGSSAAPKLDKKTVVARAPAKPKKHCGKEPGNRQKEAMQKPVQVNPSNKNKDPRLGNKTPIALGTPVAEPVKTSMPKKAQEKPSPIAAIKVVDGPLSTAEQLAKIEQDPRLLDIIEKQETDIELSEEEVNYFNTLMAQHEELSQELGLDDEDEADNSAGESLSEDDLWRKMDSSDLSQFE